MRSLGCCYALFMAIAAAQTPPSPALTDAQTVPLYQRALQLMEAGGILLPELNRAAAPMTETARGAVVNLQTFGTGNPEPHYRFLTSLRAYLLLADVVAKPDPFPEEARRQITDLRDIMVRTDVYFQALLARTAVQLRDPDRDNLKRYQEANTRMPAPNPAKPRVVFLGDSITDGWRLNEYFPDRDFVNRGISGQTTGQMLGRFKADVLDLKPSAVLILAGTNDIARGVPLGVIENNLLMMADLAVAYKIQPVLASVLPVSDYHKQQNPSYERSKLRPPDSLRMLNNWISDFCRGRGYAFANYYMQLIDGQSMLKAELAADGLHPDAPGYRLMAPVALEAIDRALRANLPKPPEKKRRLF